MLLNITYKLYRLANKLHANSHNNWWLKCITCQEYFGSHEDSYESCPLMPKGETFGPYCGKSKCRRAGRKMYLNKAHAYLSERGTFEANKILVLQEIWPFQEFTNIPGGT